MSLLFFLDKTCTISRPVATNVSGRQDLTMNYSNIATGVPVSVENAGTELDDSELGRGFIRIVLLYFDVNADVAERDRVIIGSDTYEVLELMDYANNRRRYFHKVVRAARKLDA